MTIPLSIHFSHSIVPISNKNVISLGFLNLFKKTRGRFVCHILRIYIYLIESPPAVKRISPFQFFYILILSH